MNIHSLTLSAAGALSCFARGPQRVGRLVCLVIFVSYLSAATSHAAGTVVAWGNNSDSQCSVPSGLTNVVAVAAGSLHSLALNGDGSVVGWGYNGFGETNAPADLTNAMAVAAGSFYGLALKADGTVVAWGISASVPAGLTNVAAIAAGFDHQLALKTDGTVVAWNTQYPVPAGLTNAVAIAAGNRHSLALAADGTVIAWGDNSFGKTNVPAGLKDVVAIAAGGNHSLALKSDGTVVAWGSNDSGQTNVPTAATNVAAIGTGSAHSLALKRDGTVVAWGLNDNGQARVPTGLTDIVSAAGGASHSLALKGDGSPVITVQPRSQSVVISKEAIFQVMALGAVPLNYQWQRNGTNIAGATGSALVLTHVQMSDAGSYRVAVSNSLGSVTSSNAVLTPVASPPLIVIPPQDTNTYCGDGATFQVTADGPAPFHYQWQFEGSAIARATSRVLALNTVTTNQAGHYAAVVTNAYGSTTSAVAVLTVVVEPPLITSPLTAAGKQGRAFSYSITGTHGPTSFNATGLPAGLGVNTTNGVISGTPFENGTFGTTIGTANACAAASQTLTLTITSSVPVITSPLTASGTEGQDFSYLITATESPTGFGAQGLPQGLSVDTATGTISGRPLYAGASDTTIGASNLWGIGTATLHLDFSNAPITGLTIADMTYDYSSPYLLDFEFSLRTDNDPTSGHAVAVAPQLLSVVCKEDDRAISPSETAFIVERGSMKQFKCYLVLDFTESIASLANGDANGDGISDAVENMVNAAKDFVNQQPGDSQIGVYEFHREDVAPQRVIGLTTDKAMLNQAIDGIWTNYVQWFPAGSRCWDALAAAIGGLGASNRDEQHYVIFVSDGRDESSLSTLTNVIRAAVTGDVKIYCVGFGDELDTDTLLTITSRTQGRYYTATNAADLAAEFAQTGKDLTGQYILRWATLKRSSSAFTPSFEITYQGLTAYSPTNIPYTDTNHPVIDTNTVPPTTNYPLATNIVIGLYVPTAHAGSVIVGALRLEPDAEELPTGLTLRAVYTPRYIRRLRLHYRANFPCTTSLRSTALGEILYGWSLTETNDGAGGTWLEIVSPNPESLASSLPYGVMGNLIKFSLRDMTDAKTAFSLFTVDNTIYQTTGGQSFTIENANTYVTVYPALPFGTPVPWLLAHGFTNNFVAAEVSDPDGDGVLTWQEYRANTDPRNAASKFAVRSLATTGLFGRYQITFGTSIHRKYRVESSSNLLAWQPLQDNLDGTGADITVTDTRNPEWITEMYYRVVVY